MPVEARFDAPLWRPSEGRVEQANLSTFLRRTGFSDYPALHQWSIDRPEEFWKEFWSFADVAGDTGGRAFESGPDMQSSRFFPEARLNLAENFLRRSGPEPALIAVNEADERRELSWDQLREQAFQAAGALRDAGVGPGDRVAALLPLGPEVIILWLATSALGAIFSSTSPDFGAAGVLDRFGQIEPKVLVATGGYHYGGKWFDCRERLQEIKRGLPSLRKLVLAEEMQAWASASEPITHLERFPFDHPWLVLFSSGTTGKSKCIVHRAGGVFLNLKKEHLLHCDVKSGDRVLYFTTTGWMMFNWLINGLTAGATLILFDGNPFYPDLSELLDVAEREQVTLFGTSAKYIDALKKTGLEPVRTHSFDALRTICSTGSPLSPESFAWVYSHLKQDVHLASISGGTDICGCFLLGSPIDPVYAGELQRPGLGMAMDVWDENANSLRDRPGERGELVCLRPFPSQPLRFWGDETGERYRKAYFEKYPGVWAHGDFASWTAHGGMIIHGRSDTTLNPGGVRLGTGEIYRAVEKIPSVVESLAFGQQWDNDVRVVLLVRLAPGITLSKQLKDEIKRTIQADCTPRHVPAVILAVDDLPRTRSNKLVELAVCDAVNGLKIRNIEAIANPEALWHIARLPELKAKGRS